MSGYLWNSRLLEPFFLSIKNLKDRQKEINEEIEFKNTQSLSEELYEIEDTLKKLGVNENDNINFN